MGSNLGVKVYAVERPYPEVGVGQIWKQYLKYEKNTMHTFENLNIVLTWMPMQTRTDADTYDWVTS